MCWFTTEGALWLSTCAATACLPTSAAARATRCISSQSMTVCHTKSWRQQQYHACDIIEAVSEPDPLVSSTLVLLLLPLQMIRALTCQAVGSMPRQLLGGRAQDEGRGSPRRAASALTRSLRSGETWQQDLAQNLKCLVSTHDICGGNALIFC